MANHVPQNKKADISTPSVRFTAMKEKYSWDLILDLLDGTKAMRKARRKWLPQQEAESSKAYDARLARSFLFEALGNTIDRLAAKPFKKKITWAPEEGLDQKLVEIFNDVDKSGRNVTQIGFDMLQTALKWGLTHLLVDFPSMVFFDKEGKPRKATKAEEKAAGARPVWLEISPTNLFFWKVGPDKKLTEIRFFENSIQSSGDFGDETVQQIRRLFRDKWEIWEFRKVGENDEGQWVKAREGEHSFGEIPLTTFYTDQDGELTAKPPLLKLSWLNLTHWQSYSDQRNLLNVARAGILFLKGVTQDQIDDGITAGPRSLFVTTNPDADMKWVEHKGAAIDAGRLDIEDIENKMTVLGTEPLVLKSTKETATGRSIDASANESILQAIVRREEGALNVAAEFSARWLKITLPKDFTFNIFNDFNLNFRSVEDLNLLLKARQGKELSQKTFLEELKRRGAISESVNVEEEIERIEEEGPPLGMITGDDDDDVDDTDDDDEGNANDEGATT